MLVIRLVRSGRAQHKVIAISGIGVLCRNEINVQTIECVLGNLEKSGLGLGGGHVLPFFIALLIPAGPDSLPIV